MHNTLENHQSTISIGVRSNYNLGLAGDIVLLSDSESDLQALTDYLVYKCFNIS